MPLFDLKDRSRYATFTRRTLMTTGAMAAVFGALGARLYQLEVIEGAKFKMRSEKNRVSPRLTAPSRGRILDRFGVELANNRRNFRVLLIPEQLPGTVGAALDTIGRIVPIPDRQREHILRKARQNKRFLPVVVAENLSWEQFARIELQLPYLPGIAPDVGETRAYPFSNELSHVVGYVAAVSRKDLEADPDPVLSLPDFRIGRRGIEEGFERQLRGKAGVDRVEVNAYGREIRELSREAGVPGAEVYLTIDRELQDFAFQRLGGESAATAVMDVNTGEVLALVSAPGFDPNMFNAGLSTAQWKALTSNDHHPLINKAIAGLYPPGSTIKPAMALAAVDAGLGKLEVICRGSIWLGNHQFHCWNKHGHGRVDLHRGIVVSCDVFFYEVARLLGIDRIEAGLHKLAFGHKTGIEIPGEKAGVVPGRAWKLKHYGIPWQKGETLVTGIGQGYLNVTPLQLCTLTARIASGKAVLPRIAKVIGREEEPWPRLAHVGFSEDALAAVRSGMNGVTNTPGGTAFRWRIAEPGFEMAGKTGTAQVRVISRAEHERGVIKDQNLPWKLRDHGLFIAFAPVSSPRYACATIVEHGALGHPQVQMARDILLYAQHRDPVRRPAVYPLNVTASHAKVPA